MAQRAAGVDGAVLLSSPSGSPGHSVSIPITPLRLGFLSFTQGYFRRFLLDVKTSLCNIQVNSGWFPELLVQGAQADGVNEALCYPAWPTCQPLSSINACGGGRLKINLEAFGKQELIEGHMLPIMCWGGKTWGKGLKPSSEAPVFWISCVRLCKYLHTTSKIPAVSKVLCQTPWKSGLAWGSSSQIPRRGGSRKAGDAAAALPSCLDKQLLGLMQGGWSCINAMLRRG